MPNFIPTGVTEEQLKGAVVEGAQPKPESEEWLGEVYSTLLVNEQSERIPICENGKVMFYLNPKSKYVIESWSPRTSYAPYSKITFEKNGRLSASPRRGFPDLLADAPFTILLDNRDGATSETVQIGGDFVEVLKDLPKRVSIQIEDRLIIYKAITWRLRKVLEAVPGAPDYVRKRGFVEKAYVPRKKSEIQKIKKLISDDAAEKAREESTRRFRGVVGAEEDEVDRDSEVLSPEV